MSGPIKIKSKITEIPRLLRLYGVSKFVYMLIFEIKCKFLFNNTGTPNIISDTSQENQIKTHRLKNISKQHLEIIDHLASSDFQNNVGDLSKTSEHYHVYELDRPKLVGVDGLPIINGQFLTQQFSSNTEAIGRIKYNASGSPFYIFRTHIRNSDILEGNYIRLINQKFNYFHFVTEQLTKLYYVHKTTDDFSVIVDPPYYRYHSEFHDLIENPVIKLEDGMRVEKLFEPDFPFLEPKGLKFVRSYFNSKISISPKAHKYDIVFIKRHGRRKVSNRDQIVSKLNNLGLNVISVDFTKMSLEDEIRLVQSTNALIGGHGAGLASMIWAKNLQIYELFGSHRPVVYKALAKTLNHDYFNIFGQSIGKGGFQDDIVIDYRKLIKLIDI